MLQTYKGIPMIAEYPVPFAVQNPRCEPGVHARARVVKDGAVVVHSVTPDQAQAVAERVGGFVESQPVNRATFGGDQL